MKLYLVNNVRARKKKQQFWRWRLVLLTELITMWGRRFVKSVMGFLIIN
jgi:hypothetical protein